MPFSVAGSLVSPGVFVESIIDLTAVGISGVPRIPFIVGPGEEEFEVFDLQLHRGSSAVRDNLIYKEELEDQIDALNGNRIFYVDNFPIVAGDGSGTVTNNPNDVEVLRNGLRAPVAQLDGATGKITLAVIPLDTDTLTVTYFYRRRDTLLTDQDVSAQANGTNRQFRVPVLPIVRGDDGGLATTETEKVTVTVDGTAVVVESVDGQNGLVTLAVAPGAGTEVLITYYTNKWQNSFDEVPDQINRVIRVGLIPGREDFINTVDYVTYKNRIYWGTFAFVQPGFTASATTPFDEDSIVTTTVDDHFYLEESATTPDGSITTFRTSQVPVDGTGQGISLDRLGLTDPSIAREDLIEAYVGPDPVTAFGSGRVLVQKVEADNRNIYLDLPPAAPTYATGTITIGAPNIFAANDGFTINGKSFRVALRATFDIDLTSLTGLDGRTVTINDGINPALTFEFDNDSNITAGNIGVAIGGSLAATAANLAASIAAKALAGEIDVSVANVGTNIVVNNVAGGLVTDFFATNMTGGQHTVNNDFNGYTPTADYIFSEGDTNVFTAVNARNAINAASGVNVTAVNASNVITLTATRQRGNNITLTLLNAPANIAISGATLTGAVNNFVFFTYYQGRITDNVFTAKVTRVGPSLESSSPGSCGQYELKDQYNNIAHEVVGEPTLHVVADVNFPGVPATPAMNPDFKTDLESGVAEIVTITFTSATAFTVTSSLGANGSAGTGYVGQTYQDAKTGLWFTLADPQNPANTSVLYNYAPGDVIVLRVTTPHNCRLVPTYAIPGLRTTVQSTADNAVNNTALISTYNKGGNEPDVSELYYISYASLKGDEAYLPRIYTNQRDLYNSLGRLTISNRICLGADLCFRNNNTVVGVLQRRKATNSLDASDTEYINGFKLLEEPFPGGLQADLICPLTSSGPVIAALKQHVETMSAPIYGAERRAVFGLSTGTTPAQARDFAKNIKSQRMQLIYPGGSGMVIRLPDELGFDVEYPIEGPFVAAAYAGLDTAPRYDVAEPMTRKELIGFVRSLARISRLDADLTANAGVTVIDDLEPVIRIRWAVSTDPRNVLTREANVQKIDDFVHIQQRRVLDRFIGTKKLGQRAVEIEESLSALYLGLVNAEIITGFGGTRVYTDPAEPTGFIVESKYQPVLAVNFITVRNFVTLEDF